MARVLAERFAATPVAVVLHSGLRRTERLAAMIAVRTGAELRCDPRWRERDFGAWEGRSWQAIWRETGDQMDGMLTDPHGFRPGAGETTADLWRRASAAWHALPTTGPTVVVTHGGPIAVARAQASGRSMTTMIDLVPACGAIVTLAR